MDYMKGEEPEDEAEGEDKAKQLYDMGKQLCEMAKAMGYEEEKEEEPDPVAEKAMRSGGPGKKVSGMDTAMSFFE